MRAVYSVAAVICALAVASSLITLILPQGSSKRVICAVIGVFMLCALIVPVKNAVLNNDLKINIPKISSGLTASADEAYKKAVVTETKSRLESTLVSYMLNKGYKVNSADIKLNSKYKTGIYIESISIYISKSELKRSAEIIELIKNRYDTIPKLRVT